MIRMTRLTVLVLAAACASAPAQPRAVDPVGMFDFSTSMDGTPVTGTLEIRKDSNGAYAGSLATNVAETIPVTAVTITGQQVTITATAPDSPVSITLTFTGDAFTGNWSYAGMTGQITGKRRAG
jgi:hypothetical protein